ncbi:MAG: hypothetical protein OEV33_06845, partial [Armatimonadota bacterium]|nr:hypothetical protein [Armatimonadota bacterium]
MRVVHVLGGQERGGIATHVLSLARHMNPETICQRAVVLRRTGLEERLAEGGLPTDVAPKR